MIKTVLFDMDGVLIDATEWHYEALNESLEIFGFSIPRDEHLNRFNGMTTRSKLEILSAETVSQGVCTVSSLMSSKIEPLELPQECASQMLLT